MFNKIIIEYLQHQMTGIYEQKTISNKHQIKRDFSCFFSFTFLASPTTKKESWQNICNSHIGHIKCYPSNIHIPNNKDSHYDACLESSKPKPYIYTSTRLNST